jgi:hypothetical protein
VTGGRCPRLDTDIFDGAASWSPTEPTNARAEISPQGADTRFIVTNVEGARLLPAEQQVFEDKLKLFHIPMTTPCLFSGLGSAIPSKPR